MKKLIIVNGSMGVGKSTVCRQLLKNLTPSVYLDGDWCWNMNPFVVTEENKAMVMDNITHLLNAFLRNSGYEYVIFCWVIHEDSIFDELLSRLKDAEYELYKVTLICSEQMLRKRLMQDVHNGIRNQGIIERSIARLPLYTRMDTVKLDVSGITPQQAADEICRLVSG